MFEKVNPKHPDKLADRIAGAVVDLAYEKETEPRVACEVLLGHGRCLIINETTAHFFKREIENIVKRIAGIGFAIEYVEVKQDTHLSDNQAGKVRCGDNGIFKGVPITDEQYKLTKIAKDIYSRYNYDGKYIIDNDSLIICQSNAKTDDLKHIIDNDSLIICQSNAKTDDLKHIYPAAVINPIGDWTGGTDVDSGATNRKLGSDMGDAVTGGGLHGKDLSKADISVNIYAHIKAQETGRPVELFCAIGDETVDGKLYKEIVSIAKDYIDAIGGFEAFAEWGLIR